MPYEMTKVAAASAATTITPQQQEEQSSPSSSSSYSPRRLKLYTPAEIFVINVIDLPPIFKMLHSDTRKELISIGRREANQMLDTVAEMAKRHSIRKKINTEMVETSSVSAADAIIRYAQEKDVDLIVVGTKGRSGMSKALLGSVASKIVTYSPCSVLVVR
jgi:nucleotide-binding universal stress UspA family protein